MKVSEIAGGAITIELQPDEAMDIARACDAAITGKHWTPPYVAEKDERRYETYVALFEALAVAGNAQYSIGNKEEENLSTLTAVKAGIPWKARK